MDPFLELDREKIADEVLHEHFRRYPQLRELYDDEKVKRSREDIIYHLEFMEMSIRADSGILFVHYLRWLKGLFSSIGLPQKMIVDNFKVIRDVVEKNIPDGSGSLASGLLETAINEYPGYPEDVQRHIPLDGKNSPLANEYLNLLVKGERREAMNLIMKAVESGMSVKDVYIDIFEKVQREVGALWQMNELTVAQEHYITASTQLIMAQLYPYIFNSSRKGRKMVATCVPGELHEIGIRMVADFFEMEGWETYYLGANTPLESLVDTVSKKKPDILAISSTIPTHVNEVRRMIDAVKNETGDMSPRILVGGYPFNVDPELWKKVGSDGTASDARTAIDRAKAMRMDDRG